MTNRARGLGALAVALLLAGGVGAQQPEEVSIQLPPDGQPCRIDAALSLWLAQESVDRTIAALERERRALVAEQASTSQAIDILSRADQVEGVPLGEMSALLEAQSTGREVLDRTRAELESRLTEIERTLERRRRQQAMLEARIEALDDAEGR